MPTQPLLLAGPYPPPEANPLSLHDRPAYRVAHGGVGQASLLELLTVLLGSEQTARSLLAHYGSARAIATAPVLELVRSARGVNERQAVRLKAACELGRRTLETAPDRPPTIQSPADAAALLIPRMATLEQEYLFALLLDARNQVKGEPVEVYHGALDRTLIRPGEVFREAVRANAAAIILAHNHPSGRADESPEDRAVTVELAQVGKLLDIALLDHLIIGGNTGTFVSLKERGVINVK